MKKPLCLVMTAILLLGLLGGCGSSSSSIVKYDIDGPVTNLDPQYATSATARMIIGNIYEGLVVQAPTGEILPGAAVDYQVSPDGLAYTFRLREGVCWSDGVPLTADDFVFTFRRLFDRRSPSPYGGDYISIENAALVLEGTAPSTQLGVSAPDEETVVFRLEHPNPFFLELLAATPAMPCNRSLFDDARGRYGLELRYVASNGPFLLETWDNTRYLLLRANEAYLSDTPATAAGVNLYIGREDPVGQFLDGESHLISVPHTRLAALQESDARLESFDKTTWSIVFNQRDPVLANALVRQALVHAVDHGLLEDVLSPDLSATGVFIPPAMRLLEDSFRSLAGSDAPLTFDTMRAEHLFQLGLEGLEVEAVPAMTLLVPDEDPHPLAAGMIQQSWQRYLGVYVNIESVPREELDRRYAAGDYQLLLTDFTPSTSRIDSLLGIFSSSSPQNYTGYRNILYDLLLLDAMDESTVADTLQKYHKLEQLLLRDAVVLPLYRENTTYAMGARVQGIEIFPFAGRISFKNARIA